MLPGDVDLWTHGGQQVKIKLLLFHFPVQNTVFAVFKENADLAEFRCDVIQNLLGAQLQILKIIFVKARFLLLHERDHDLCHYGNMLRGNTERGGVTAGLFISILKALHLVQDWLDGADKLGAIGS